MRMFAGGVMRRWDELLKQYDCVKIRSLCGGRFRYGYPPSVGEVDVRLPWDSHFLHDSDCIALIEASNASAWSLAIRGARDENIYELPSGTQVLVGDYIVSLDKALDVQELPLGFITGVITDAENKRLYVFNTYHIICFGERGLLWENDSLFAGDMFSVSLNGDRIECVGSMYWIDADKDFKIVFDATTGVIIGGDAEAIAHHKD